MRWSLALTWINRPYDPIAEAARMWDWMEQLRRIHPPLHTWRRTAKTREQAYANPPLTKTTLTQGLLDRQEINGLTGAPSTRLYFFCANPGGESQLSIALDLLEEGKGNIIWQINHGLGAYFDQDETLVEALFTSAIEAMGPCHVGEVSRVGHSLRPDHYPFEYSPGWKMFFATTNPHHDQGLALATKTRPLANGTLMTFGTPDTYPQILDTWPR